MSGANSETGWWSQFLDALAKPELWADGLVAMLATAVSIVAAGALFLRQIDHDRQLFQTQIKVDRLNVSAVRRGEVARELGRALISASHEFVEMDSEQLEGALRADPSGMASETVPGAEKMRQAYKVASLELDLDEVIMTLWSRRLEWWRAVGLSVRRPEFIDLPAERRRSIIMATLATRFDRWDRDIASLGRALLRWDGGMSTAGSRGELQIGATRPPSLNMQDRLALMADSSGPAYVDAEARSEMLRHLTPEP